MAKQISLDEIRIDGGTQMRQQIDYPTVDDYANAFASGAKMPPVDVFNDGATNWLANGFHRVHGAKKAGLKKIDCEVHQGTLRDAILFAVGANHDNGLRRTPADKRVAVMKLLHDPEWVKCSNRWIGGAARVDGKTVAEYRKQVKSTAEFRSSPSDEEKRTGRDGKARKSPKKNPSKKVDLHVPPIDAEPEPVAIKSPVAGKKLKTFDNEKQLIRQIVAMVAAVRETRFDVEFDKGRLVHELNEWANYIAEQTESAEEAA